MKQALLESICGTYIMQNVQAKDVGLSIHKANDDAKAQRLQTMQGWIFTCGRETAASLKKSHAISDLPSALDDVKLADQRFGAASSMGRNKVQPSIAAFGGLYSW